MKRLLVCLLIGVAMLVVVAGCSKQPAQEMTDAKTLIDAVVAEGGEKYAKEDLKNLNDAMTTAMDEIGVQDKKFFKNYDTAKAKLAEVIANAQTLKTELPAKKEKAKTEALASQAQASTDIAEAKGLLKKAPRGKGSRADIEAMNADVSGLDAGMAEVQTLIDSEDYFAAKDKAAAISEKAKEVTSQVTLAMEKVGKKVGKKK